MAATATRALDSRDVDALTGRMTVLDDIGQARDAPGLYVVVSDSGRSYLVDSEGGACTCDDSLYRSPDGGCKHYRRTLYAVGRREIPAWVDHSQIDPLLGDHVGGGD